MKDCMKNLEKQIADLINKNVQLKNKSAMRSKILANIKQEVEFKQVFSNAISAVNIPIVSKSLMREKLMLIVNSRFKSSFYSFFNVFVRKEFVASFVLCLFFLGFIMQPFTEVGSVKAYSPPKITTFSGAVTVERQGELLRVSNDFTLQENDIVQTGPAGFAEIVFADSSLVRLSTSTRLRLRQVDTRIVNSITELSLHSGDLWVNTLGLTGLQSSFTVHSRDLSVTANRSSIFDVKASDEYVRVVALSDVLGLSLYNEGIYIPTTLNKGNLVKVRQETKYSTYLDQLSFQNRLYDFDLDWIVSNYTQDQFYIETLSRSRLAELERIAGITPDSYFYPVKEFRRAARLAMTFDPVRQAKLELMYANQKLIEAEVLFERGKDDTAKRTLSNSSSSLARAAKKVSSLKTNENQVTTEVALLKEEITDSIALQRRAMGDVVAVDESEDVRKIVNEAERLLASNPADLRKVELGQLNSLLEDAKLLIEANKTNLAEEKLAEYLTSLEGLSEELDLLAEAEEENILLSLIDSNLNTILKLGEFSETNNIEEETLNTVEEDVLDEEIDEELERVEISGLLESIELASRSNLEKALELAEQVKNPTFQTELNRLNLLINSSLEDLKVRRDVVVDKIDVNEVLNQSVEVKN